MGVSTDAYLFFGFEFHDEEGENPCENQRVLAALEEDGDLDNLYMEEVEGKFYPGTGDDNFDYEDPKNRKSIDDFYGLKTKLMKEAGVEVSYHCHGDFPIWFLTIHQITACRGDSTQIDLDELKSHITEEKINKLKKFCEILEIEYQEPKWILASYWG